MLKLGFRWEFICRSEELVAIAIILSTWGPSCETKSPLLNAIGVCPNAASGLCRWKVLRLGTYCIILSPYSEFQKSMLFHEEHQPFILLSDGRCCGGSLFSKLSSVQSSNTPFCLQTCSWSLGAIFIFTMISCSCELPRIAVLGTHYRYALAEI